MSPFLALALIQVSSPSQALLEEMRYAVGSGSEARIQQLFARAENADYLLRMARNRGGLTKLSVKLIPTPPGFIGPYWAIFHTFQDIEEDHDAVYEVQPLSSGLKLGPEVPEAVALANPLVSTDVRAALDPPKSLISVIADLTLKGQAGKATVLRLNDVYNVSDVQVAGKPAKVVTATDQAVPTVQPGEVVRAGGLLIPYTTAGLKSIKATYSGVINRPSEDKITSSVAYVTAWWVPSTARTPHPSKLAITGPRDWVLRGEGVETGFIERADSQTRTFRCDVPIAYPKVIAGKYTLVASKLVGGKRYRSYQLEPVDEARANRDVNEAAKSIAWFEENLGPFPFPGYDIFDADTYYGIESYSHTLLRRDITTRFASHEIGHTYFGGLVPSSYREDSWNEGLTQYVDSVLYLENRDKTLEAGQASVKVAYPLTVMGAAHDYEGMSYYRGAYVMRMLEDEYGRPAVLQALRAMIKDRPGKDTRWADLRPYFEESTGADLKGFWNQWVEGSTFPLLKIAETSSEQRDGKWETRVTLQQSGTLKPYRLRFGLKAIGSGVSTETIVIMKAPMETFKLVTDFRPSDVLVNAFGRSLVTVARSANR